MDTASLVTVRPNPRVWWGLLFIPLATFVFLAIALGVYRAIAGSEVSRTALLWIWGILTVAVLAWSIVRDPHLLTWSLTERDLRRGKKQHNLVIPFDDIESIVIGMPPRLPWFFRIARFHPRSSGAYRNLVTVRPKLSGQRHTRMRRFDGSAVLASTE